MKPDQQSSILCTISNPNSSIFTKPARRALSSRWTPGLLAAAALLTTGSVHGGTLVWNATSSAWETATAWTPNTAMTLNTGGTLLMNGSSNNIGSGGVTPNAASQTIPESPSGATVTGAGGTIAVATGTGGNGTSQTFSSLTQSANSTLDFSSGVCTTNTNVNLFFNTLDPATKTALTAGTTTLTINNWNGSAYQGQLGNLSAADTGTFGDGQDRLVFTTDPGFGLGNVISGVNFNGFGAGAPKVAFGTMFEIVPVPEPATIFGALGALGFIGWRERRRFASLLPGKTFR